MKFDATEDVILEMGRLAVNAAIPMGIGWLHAESKDYTKEDVKEYLYKAGLNIDYFHGRMTKLYIRRVDKTTWEMSDNLRHDYQSWIPLYPSSNALLKAAREATKD